MFSWKGISYGFGLGLNIIFMLTLSEIVLGFGLFIGLLFMLPLGYQLKNEMNVVKEEVDDDDL